MTSYNEEGENLTLWEVCGETGNEHPHHTRSIFAPPGGGGQSQSNQVFRFPSVYRKYGGEKNILNNIREMKTAKSRLWETLRDKPQKIW